MMEHKHAALLRMAADNADQRFECERDASLFPIWGKACIDFVLANPNYNWRPVAKPKKTIKRWLWANKDGFYSGQMHSQPIGDYTIKLLWSETEFEVDDD